MKLSKPKRSKYLTRCRGRIEAAKGFRKTNDLEDLWDRMRDLYRGKHFPKDLSYEDAVAVNICFSTINVIVPAVSVNRPRTRVRARTPENHDRAVITEAVVNYWWEEFEILPEFQLSVKDSLIFGLGWLKTGYRFVEEEVDDPAGFEQKLNEKRAELDAYAAANPEMAAGLPDDDEIEAGIVSTKNVIRHDQPFVERVSIKDVYVDPEATSLRDAKWVAQKVTKTLEEVRSNEQYKASSRREIQSDQHIDEGWFNDEHVSEADKHDRQRVTVWEFYDLQNGQMCVFSDIGDDFLVDPVAQPYAYGQPFIDVRNYEVPDQFYPMGELEALEPLQHELNMTRTAMFNDRKAFRRAWLYKDSAFDTQGRAQLQSDADNRLIPVNGNLPLQEAIIPLPGAQVNPQMYQDSQVIEGDIQTITGISEYMRGGGGDIRRTATEASMIQDAANARAADKLAHIEQVISLVSKRLAQLAKQFMSAEKVARIAGKGGNDLWVEYARDDIDDCADFSVEAGSTQPRNPMQRRQTAMEMLQALAPFGDPQLGLVDMSKVIQYALQYGFEVDDPSMFMPDPAQMNPQIAALGDPNAQDPMGGSIEEQIAAEGGGGTVSPVGESQGTAPAPEQLQGAF